MFYLRNPSMNPADIFPMDIPEKLCANFTCKGKACNNTNCNFAHPRKALELKRETIIVIVNHFIKNDVGWFNKYHFMRMPNITDGVKNLFGNTKGLPVRWLGLSDSCIVTWQIHWITKTLLDCIPMSLTSRRGPSLSTKSGLSTSSGSCIFWASS